MPSSGEKLSWSGGGSAGEEEAPTGTYEIELLRNNVAVLIGNQRGLVRGSSYQILIDFVSNSNRK